MYHSKIWHWLFMTLSELVSIYFEKSSTFSNLAYISGLNCVTKTYKKQQLREKNSNSFGEEGENHLQSGLLILLYSHPIGILPTDKCNSIVHMMKGKEVQVSIILKKLFCMAFSIPGSQLLPLLCCCTFSLF